MVNQRTMFLCPSCSCHARREEQECPHCGAPLTREAGASTQRSMAAVAMGLALAVALPVAGCGDDASGRANGQGGGSGGANGTGASGGDGGAAATPTGSGGSTSSDGGYGSATVTQTIANGAMSTYGAPPSAGPGGGGACLDEPLFADPTCDECAQRSCCPEVEACLRDPARCFDAEGLIDPGTDLGPPLIECLSNECGDECSGGPGICDSGLTSGDPDFDLCLGEFCCVEHSDCMATDPDACIACFQAGGGKLCNAAIACAEENCAE